MKLETVAPRCIKLTKQDGTEALYYSGNLVAVKHPTLGYFRIREWYSKRQVAIVEDWLDCHAFEFVDQTTLNALV